MTALRIVAVNAGLSEPSSTRLLVDRMVAAVTEGLGAGRADVTIANGDLPTGTIVHASECWSSSFERVYWTDNIGLEPDEGAVSSCAFEDAEY